ncbi:YopX family protein [Streptococcus sp. K0074]|uniref:YopX family protein n=1 Tax=Streptococcus sp. K0074 TaxID=3402868 RepID=UPI003B680604
MIPRYRVWHHELGRLMSVKCMFFHDSEIEEFELNDALMNDYITAYPDEIVLMQSTGLKDKNDKEIFEGDILACETDNEVINLNVFWDEEHALFMFESKKYNEQEPLAELVENNTYPFEIIGNIYENPDLLEDK